MRKEELKKETFFSRWEIPGMIQTGGGKG